MKGAGSGTTTSDYWRVNWYVIDPKLDDIIDSSVLNTDWQPELVASGVLANDETNPDIGHRYNPVIGVTRTGQAYIEYTFSSHTHKQRIQRAALNSTYTGIVSTTTLQLGPDMEHEGVPINGPRWALYADMQADPSTTANCKWLFSTHTLVNDIGDPPSSFATPRRDIWLFRKGFTPFCFQTDMNQSGFTDPFDMMMYTDYYMQGDSRADTDDDGSVDVTDMATFIDAYDAATGP